MRSRIRLRFLGRSPEKMKNRHLLLFALFASMFAGCDQLPVTAPPGDYDLEATSVTFTPKEVFVGDPVVFSKVISNVGKDAIPARSYEVDLYLEEDRISFDHATSMIPPGGNIPYGMAPGYHHWKPTKPGTYTYRFVVDERNRLAETNEGNNQIIGVITVKAKPKGESGPRD